jgi:hypothetical protein
MVSLGALRLQFEQKYQYGWRTAYYRDTVRYQILKTRPITHTGDRTCEIHVFTCAKDWLNLIWTLKSFYWAAHRQYALCIHDDGTLGQNERDTLWHHFPNARVIDRPSADAKVSVELQAYPKCSAFRQSNHLAPKVFDFASYLESDRMLLLDSDILFFAEPTELLRRIEDPNYRLNTVNGDVSSAYTIDPQVVKEQMGVEVIERFNSGLGLIHRSSMRLDWIEAFLALPDVLGHFWRIEQTLYALFSSQFGVELLPPDYDVHLEGGIGRSACRHYVGKIRHLMYDEGMRQLVKQGFLRTLSES